MSELKPRFDKDNLLNDVVRSDWLELINSDPDNYQALLYIPIVSTPDDVDPLYEEEAHTVLDNNQETLEYQTPFVVNVLDAQVFDAPFAVNQDGEDGYADTGDIHTLKIAHSVVPVGSIVEWEERLHDETTRRVWWYVQSSQSIGTTSAGKLHILIPCRDFDSVKVNDD